MDDAHAARVGCVAGDGDEVDDHVDALDGAGEVGEEDRAAPLSTPTSTTPSGWSAAMRLELLHAAGDVGLTEQRPRLERSVSLGDAVASVGVAQHHRAQAAPRPASSTSSLWSCARLGVALAHVREQDLAEQHRLAGERYMRRWRASTPREEPGSDGGDLGATESNCTSSPD